MTVLTSSCFAERAWTGVETAYAPGFPAYRKEDLRLVHVSLDGTRTPLTLNVHYVATLAEGTRLVTVNPLPAMPAGPATIEFGRETQPLQPTDFQDGVRYPQQVHEDLADIAAMRDQEVRQAYAQLDALALRVLPGQTPPVMNVTSFLGRLLGIDGNGQLVPVTANLLPNAINAINILDSTTLGRSLMTVGSAVGARLLIDALAQAAMPVKTRVVTFDDSFGMFEGGYTEPLAALLGDQFDVRNESIGGDLPSDGVARINQDILHLPPSIVVIGFAVNRVIIDQVAGLPAATTIATVTGELQQMYTALKTAGHTVIAKNCPPLKGFIASGPVDVWATGQAQPAIDGINDWIANDAVDVDRRVDIYSVLVGSGSEAFELKAIYNVTDAGHAVADKLHPNTAGRDAMAAEIATAGIWPLNTSQPVIKVLADMVRLNQDLLDESHVRFRSVTVGRHANSGIAAVNIRAKDDTNEPELNDQPQLGLEQINANGNTWTFHNKLDAALYISWWAAGSLQRNLMALAPGATDTSSLFGRWDVVDDARPLRWRTSSYDAGLGVGSASDEVPFLSAGIPTGYRNRTWGGGGSLFGDRALLAKRFIFEFSGVEKIRFKDDGSINLAYLPIYADDAAAGAGGLGTGDLYGVNTSGTVYLARKI